MTDSQKEALKELLQNKSSYDVMAALRGPDQDSNEKLVGDVKVTLKGATTGVIRYHAGMLENDFLNGSIYIGNSMGALSCKDRPEFVEYRKSIAHYDSDHSKWYTNYDSGVSSHFVSHAILAFKELGLKWGELN